MSVYRPKNKDGSPKSPHWHFDFVITVNGERRRVYGSTGETAKAKAREVEAKERARAKAERPNDDMTLAAACIRYCDEVSNHQRSADDTEKGLEHCVRLIGGARPLVNITSDDISKAVRRRATETYGKINPRQVTPATVNRQIVEVMQRLMRRARRVWKVGCDPEGIDWGELRMKEPKERVRELSSDEADAFWAALRPDYVPLLWFLANRGLRVRAALGMTKKTVDLQNRRIQVWRKSDGMVWVPLTADQVAALSTEMARSPFEEVWTYEVQRKPHAGMRKPITYNGLRRVMGNTLEAAGITDFRIHDLRHDFASKLLRATRNLELVRKALGHSDIASTVRYAHVLDEDVAAGMEALSRRGPGMAVTKEPKIGAK